MILNYRFVMKAMSKTPCALIWVLYTGKGKWKVGVVGVSILQNRPDCRGDSKEKEAKAQLGVTEQTGENRMKTTVRAHDHFTSTPPSGQSASLPEHLRPGPCPTASCCSLRLSEFCTEPSMRLTLSKRLSGEFSKWRKQLRGRKVWVKFQSL